MELTYDRALTVGSDTHKGLIQLVRKGRDKVRGLLKQLRVSYALIDAREGSIVSQYGGKSFLDMSMAQQPVMGSVFKVITLLAAHRWPADLPLLNKGQSWRNARRFAYHPTAKEPHHTIHNSHKMPAFVTKDKALAMSANIAFVYLSLYWTWMLDEHLWKRVMVVGLQQLLQYRLKVPKATARKRALALINQPKELIKLLRKDLGYTPYLKHIKRDAVFEATKAAVVKELLVEVRINKRLDKDAQKPKVGVNLQGVKVAPQKPGQAPVVLTLEQRGKRDLKASDLSQLLAAKSRSDLPNNAFLMATFDRARKRIAWAMGKKALLQLSWNKEFRQEMGLRYLIFLATQLAGMDIAKSHLTPVLTLTLGVNNVSTRELATLVASITAKRPINAHIVSRVTVQGSEVYHFKPSPHKLPLLPASAYEKTQRAMSLVLRGGTGLRAGRLLERTFGSKLLFRSGAKTGTVQDSRGVSCIGFVGHRVGALTFSTPDHKPLKTHVLRGRLPHKRARSQKKLAKQKKHLKVLSEKEKNRKRKWRKKRAKRRIKQLKRKLKRLDKTIKKRRLVAKTYIKAKGKLKEAKKRKKPTRKLKRKVRRLKHAFRRAYTCRTLRSSDACHLLFALLIHWKQRDRAWKKAVRLDNETD